METLGSLMLRYAEGTLKSIKLQFFAKEKTVPWKDPSNWLHAELLAPLLSFALSFLRAMYDDKEPRWLRRLTESAICGMITLSSGYAIDALGLAGEWKYAAAGAIGFLGADYIRSVAKKIVSKKVNQQ